MIPLFLDIEMGKEEWSIEKENEQWLCHQPGEILKHDGRKEHQQSGRNGDRDVFTENQDPPGDRKDQQAKGYCIDHACCQDIVPHKIRDLA